MSNVRSNLAALVRPTVRAGAIATAAVIFTDLVGRNGFDAAMQAELGGNTQEITTALAVASTLVMVAVGSVVAAGLASMTPRAATVFTTLAVLIYAGGFATPIMGGVDTATIITLLIMHTVVLVPVLTSVVPALRDLAAGDVAAVGSAAMRTSG